MQFTIGLIGLIHSVDCMGLYEALAVDNQHVKALEMLYHKSVAFSVTTIAGKAWPGWAQIWMFFSQLVCHVLLWLTIQNDGAEELAKAQVTVPG